MQFIGKTTIDFVGNRWKLFLLSGFLVGGSIVSLATRGLVFGIDFTGGTVVQVTFEKPMNLGDLRKAVEESGIPDASLQSFPKTNTFSIRMKSGEEASAADIEVQVAAIQKAVGENKFRIESQEFVGPAVGKHLYRQALWAIVLSLLGIIVYIAFRFENPIWGVAGVVAIGHDVLATLGLFSVTGCEVDLLIVSALLTIAGYSINDTIVIFDRMRELMKLYRHEPLDATINRAVNETLSRTIITNGTVFTVVLILFLLGGKVIHNFAMAMVFGAVVGTYSTIAIASPMVFEWYVRMKRPGSSPQPAGRPAGKARR
ncbi:MAG: protein translocase subunit SecF [Elusimicrobia bacterium]|nr:protein translocase subunit SecF [Elusimicrobiota bacterium]